MEIALWSLNLRLFVHGIFLGPDELYNKGEQMICLFSEFACISHEREKLKDGDD